MYILHFPARTSASKDGRLNERMAKMKLLYNTSRDAYGIEDIRRTMTVGELMRFLENYDSDTQVFLGFDNGYTYGGLDERCFEEIWEEECSYAD